MNHDHAQHDAEPEEHEEFMLFRQTAGALMCGGNTDIH
jgi:hypothetical protein